MRRTERVGEHPDGVHRRLSALVRLSSVFEGHTLDRPRRKRGISDRGCTKETGLATEVVPGIEFHGAVSMES